VADPGGAVRWLQAHCAMVPGDELQVLGQFQDVTARKAAEAQLTVRATRDALTGLLTREPFGEALDAALAARSADAVVAVLLLDLDRFKDINDGLGHHIGDLVLEQAAARMAARGRRSDVVARVGGDEFTILLSEVASVEDLIAVASDVSRVLESPFNLEGVKVHVGASIGIAVAPSDGLDGVTLMKKADVAMYRAKALRSGWAVYQSDEDETGLDRIGLVGDLRETIEAGALDVAYQPMVETRTGREG
jgi:diguanylate cyclase (GGDEF)-like protein